jgi:hypothetical protein
MPTQSGSIDLFTNTETNYIETLHNKGRKVVCYFSAGSSESWRPDYGMLPRAGIGKKMDGWDENWLDIRSSGVRAVMQKRLDLAASCFQQSLPARMNKLSPATWRRKIRKTSLCIAASAST